MNGEEGSILHISDDNDVESSEEEEKEESLEKEELPEGKKERAREKGIYRFFRNLPLI